MKLFYILTLFFVCSNQEKPIATYDEKTNKATVDNKRIEKFHTKYENKIFKILLKKKVNEQPKLAFQKANKNRAGFNHIKNRLFGISAVAIIALGAKIIHTELTITNSLISICCFSTGYFILSIFNYKDIDSYEEINTFLAYAYEKNPNKALTEETLEETLSENLNN